MTQFARGIIESGGESWSAARGSDPANRQRRADALLEVGVDAREARRVPMDEEWTSEGEGASGE